MKAEVLAARADGLRNVFRLGGCHHEDDVIGRLFQRFQQGIESRIGDLVGFVEDVDLVAIPCGRYRAASRSSRISSMPRFVAASISITSTAFPARISVQDSQMPQGSGVGLVR